MNKLSVPTQVRFFSAFVLLLPALLLLPASTSRAVAFQIMEGSSLRIEGTSNVTDFTCHCTESFPKAESSIIKTGDRIRFSKAILQVQSKKLHCGNKAMNNDMYEALKANEYPHIFIELLEVRQSCDTRLTPNGDWATMNATAQITIAGVSRKETLLVQAMQATEREYQFKGNKKLLLTDYGIRPPRPMMGLIKVANEIAIDLDLCVQIL